MEETRSLIEIAIDNMNGKKKPQNIYKFLDEVLSIKGISSDDENYLDLKAQLYTDMTVSARFVYCGEDEWDLKDRETLDLWDKDASYFNTDVEEDEEDEDDITLDDYNLEEKDEEDEIEVDDEIIEELDEHEIILEEDDPDYDEEKYNDVMDDYEDLYDK